MGIRVEAVIPVGKNTNRLNALIQALAEQTFPVSRVILSSTEENGDLTKGLKFPESLFIEQVYSVSESKGALLNRGIKAVDSEFVLLLNPEIVLEDKNAISILLNGFSNENTVVSCARNMCDPEVGRFSQGLQVYMNGSGSYDRNEDNLFRYGAETFMINNNFTIYKRSAFDELGFFEPDGLSDPVYTWAADAVYAGKNLHYEAGTAVTYTEKTTFAKEIGRAFDFGAARKTYVQSFGMGFVYLHYEIRNKGYEVIVRAMKHHYADVRKAAVRHALKKGRIDLIPVYFILQCFCSVLDGAGKRYQRLPVSVVKFFGGNKEFWKSL